MFKKKNIMHRGKHTVVTAIEILKQKAEGGQARLGDFTLTDTAFYINFDANGLGGKFNLVDSKTRQVVGVTNIDGEKFAAGKDVVIDAISLKCGFGLSIDSADYSDNFGIDARVKNAEIRINQGKNVLLNLPVTEIIANENTIEIFKRALTTPILIKSNQLFEIQIELPKNQSITNLPNVFFRLEMTATQAKR